MNNVWYMNSICVHIKVRYTAITVITRLRKTSTNSCLMSPSVCLSIILSVKGRKWKF